MFFSLIRSGSGCVSTFLAQLLGPWQCRKSIYTPLNINSLYYVLVYLCTDINIEACQASQLTSIRNQISLEILQTDLFDSLLPRLYQKIDILLFNPPYVVTPDEELNSTSLPASWAGGLHGRCVMDRLFPFIHSLLSPTGVFYLVTIQENKPNDIIEILEKQGLKGEVVLSRKAGSEGLRILRFQRVKTMT
jgi:release factor glutamine methyltransferase